MKKIASKELKRHYKNVAEIGCILTGFEPQLHHVFGGSIKDRGFSRGMGQRGVNEFWVIPLCHHYHQGSKGIHTIGVRRWEERYGTQWDLLNKVWDILGYDAH